MVQPESSFWVCNQSASTFIWVQSMYKFLPKCPFCQMLVRVPKECFLLYDNGIPMARGILKVVTLDCCHKDLPIIYCYLATPLTSPLITSKVHICSTLRDGWWPKGNLRPCSVTDLYFSSFKILMKEENKLMQIRCRSKFCFQKAKKKFWVFRQQFASMRNIASVYTCKWEDILANNALDNNVSSSVGAFK